MRILTRQITIAIAGAFTVALLALCFFFVLVDLLTRRLDGILEAAVPWLSVAAYYVSLLPAAIVQYQLVGLAMVIAVLAVMGTYARRNELTAMLAAGIPLHRQAAPAFAISLCLVFALLAMSQWVTPRAEQEARRFQAEYFSNSVLEYWGTREPISWSNLEDGWTCHITKFNRVALSGEEVFLLQLGEEREQHVRARRIYWDEARELWILEDGSWAVYSAQPGFEGKSAMSERRITQAEAPLAETPAELFEPFDPPAGFATTELPSIIRTAEHRHVPVGALRVEFHSRFAGAALPLVMTVIAAPLATRIRRGGRSVAIAVAVGLAVAYFALFIVSLNLGRIGRLDPWVSAWLANGIFGLLGLGMLRRIPT